MTPLKQIAIFVIGATLILIGTVLLAIPGPGLLVIFAGLAVLSTEFVWARRLSHGLYDRVVRWRRRRGRKPPARPDHLAPDANPDHETDNADSKENHSDSTYIHEEANESKTHI